MTGRPLCVLVLLALVLPATPGQLSANDAFIEYVTPRGEFANLDTHRLYYRCIGQGSPSVVIEHGIGGAALEWTEVQDELAKTTRVCTYDRAGYGFSDSGPGPRNSSQAANELHRLLEIIGERPPYVLVGHSFGGLSARHFASMYAEEMAGLVLIEASHVRMLPSFGARTHEQRHGLQISAIEKNRRSENPYAAASGFLNSRRKAIFAQMEELSHFQTSAEQVTRRQLPSELPLVVLSRDPLMSNDNAMESAWASAQRELATLTNNSKQFVIQGADHNPHLAKPIQVAQRVASLITSLR